MSDPKMICVTGPDGAGKTTQIVRLAERLERGRKLKVAVVTIWDLLLDTSISGKIGFDDPAQVDRYLAALQPTSRALFLYHCFATALDLAHKKKPQILLLNAYWYKYYATEVAHGGDAQKLLRLADVFPEPAQTFYLALTPEEAFRRKAGLSGYETGFAAERDEQAFVGFQTRAHAALEPLIGARKWVRLDGKRDAAELTQVMLDQIPE